MSKRRALAGLLGDFYEGSIVKDARGKPLTVYRGEHGAPGSGPFQSKLPSVTFTDDAEAASQYALDPNDHRDIPVAPRVIPAHLSIKHPVINNPSDPFVDLVDIERKLGLENAKDVARRFDEHIQNTGNWEDNFAREFASVSDVLKRAPQRVNELYMNAYPLLDDPWFVQQARRAGYDGAAHIGNGETATSMEYRIFDPKQARAPWGLLGGE